jgi:hypothetical protein
MNFYFWKQQIFAKRLLQGIGTKSVSNKHSGDALVIKYEHIFKNFQILYLKDTIFETVCLSMLKRVYTYGPGPHNF